MKTAERSEDEMECRLHHCPFDHKCELKLEDMTIYCIWRGKRVTLQEVESNIQKRFPRMESKRSIH